MIKPHFFRFFSVVSVLLTVCLMVAGCDCGECTAPQDLASTAPTLTVYYRMAPMMPPAPLMENVIVPETPRNLLWRPGYWAYDGGKFEWVSGELMARPSPTAVWLPDHWIEHSYGWTFEPGHWQ